MEMTDDEVFGSDPETTGSTGQSSELSDAEVFGQGASAPADQGPGELSDEDVFGNAPGGSAPSQGQQPSSGSEWSAPGSFAAGAAKGAIPTTGGLAAGLYAGAAATPFVGPVGGVLAGLAVGAGVGSLIDYGEDKLLAALGFDKPLDKAREANPTAFDLGTMAPAAALLRPGGTMLQRGIGGAIGGAAEAGTELLTGNDLDAKKIGMAAGLGAALPNANKLGSKVIASGEAVGARYRGGNKNPDLKVLPEEKAAEEGAIPDDDEITVDNTPAPQEADLAPAEDVAMTAPGVAMENSQVPEIPGTGNPGKAAGAAHEAARPSDPVRNYQKDQAQTQPELSDNKIIDTVPMKSDIEAALTGEAHTQPEGEQVPQPAPGDGRTPQDQGAVPTNRIPQGPSDGILDAARVNREALAKIHERMSASQKGEDFHGLENPDAVPSAEPVRPQEEAAPLSPADAKDLAENRKLMVKAGWDRALAVLDKMSPQEQVAKLRDHREALNKASQQTAVDAGQKKADALVKRPDGEVRKERRLTNSLGYLAEDKNELAYHEHGIKLRQDIFKDFGPQSERGKAIDPLDASKTAELKDYAKEVWAEAVHRNGGKDPLNRSETYTPSTKGHPLTKELEWLRAIRDAKNGAGLKRLAQAHAVDDTEMAKLTAETGRVEGDITRRPQLPEAAEQAETAQDLGGSRTTFEHMNPDPRPGADNSYVDDHNKLADWLNERSPAEYEKLSENYELKAEMDEPADPASLLSEMKQTLVDTGRRPKGEITTEVDLPPKKVEVPNLPNVEEPKPSGRVIDKKSDEFKRLAAQYNEQVKTANTRNTEARLASELKAAKNPENIEREPVKGTWKDLAEKFAKDQSGAGKAIPLPNFLKPNPVMHNPVAKEAVEHLNKEFNVSMGAIQNTETRLMANYVSAQDRPGVATRREMYKKAETDQPFTPEEQKYYDQTIKPLKDWYTRVINIAEKAGLLPDEFTRFQGVTARHVPRMLEPKAPTGNNDQPWRREFSSTADPLKERDFFSLDDGNGQRILFRMNDSGKVALLRDKKISALKNVPPGFTGKLGDQITLSVKGSPKAKFTVDHATTNEIEKHVPDKVHVKDLELAYSNAIQKIQGALIRDNIISRIKNDPRMEQLQTKSAKEAKEKGWDTEPTTLKELARDKFGHPIYYDPKVRWWMDDMAKPGIDDYDFMRKVNNAAAAMAKPLYFTSPLFHVLNVGQNYALAMGQDALRFRTYPRIASEGFNAMKEVFTQGPLNQEYAAAGGRPMLHSQLMDGGLMRQLMEKAGLPIPGKPSIFDPLSKATGVPIADILHHGMVASNKIMWAGNDMFALALYQRNKRMGMSPREAVDATERWIGAYRPDSQTFGGSRVAQKLLNTPALSWFGPYHQDLWRSVGNIAKGLTTQIGDKHMRQEAVGALAMGSVMMFVVYPMLLDKAAQLISGNENAEFGRRGLLAIPDAIGHMVKGDRDHTRLMQSVLTPSIPANLVMQGITNKDWRGKDVAPAGPMYDPQHLAKSGARLADWGLGLAVPPIGSMNAEARQDDGGVLPWAKKFLEAGVGIKDPSEGATKYEDQIERTQNREEKRRVKRPAGVIEGGINRLFD